MKIRITILILFTVLSAFWYADAVIAVDNEFNVGCKVGRLTNYTLAVGWNLKLAWEKEYYDIDNMHDGVTNTDRVYCVADGRYQIIAIVAASDMLVDESLVISLRVNDGETTPSGGIWATQGYSTAPGQYMFQCNGQVDLFAGDYVNINFYNPTTSTITLFPNTNFGIQRIGIGGESMEMSLAFPPAIYGVAIGLVLILINLKAKMALLWLAAAICFIGVFFDPALSDTYYQAAAIVIIVACLVAGFFGYKSKRSSLG